jgi:alpha-galactosidase/6-phospho-beta-glucosidase family protein
MNLKISLIGAGSGAFSLSLIRDLCLTKNLEGCTVSFMDINQERLEGSYQVCRRYAEELNVHLNFEKTLDRQESLQGADFVINTALAAGHHRLRAGWEIAKGYGYRWGGSLVIMHDEAFWINYFQLDLFESIVQDILRICPNAWYLQVANSVLGGTTYLTRKYPKLKMTGLCHGFNGVYHVASLLNLEPGGGYEKGQLTFELPGVNHFIWLTKMFYKGQDILPLFHEWVEQQSQAYFETCAESDHMGPKPVDLYRRMGAVPIGDTATVGGGAWGWWYHTDAETERRYKENPGKWWEGYFNWVDHNARENYRIGNDPQARMTEYLKPEASGEEMVPIIESIACDIPRTYIVNIPNRGGLVPGVPADFAVEVPALVSARGIQGIQTDGLPPLPLAYLIRDRVVPWELELAAYEQGSRHLLEELVGLDPWTKSTRQAYDFVHDLLAMNGHEKMAQHYR